MNRPDGVVGERQLEGFEDELEEKLRKNRPIGKLLKDIALDLYQLSNDSFNTAIYIDKYQDELIEVLREKYQDMSLWDKSKFLTAFEELALPGRNPEGQVEYFDYLMDTTKTEGSKRRYFNEKMEKLDFWFNHGTKPKISISQIKKLMTLFLDPSYTF